MTKNEKFQKMAEDVLKAVGGRDNVSHVTHCMTRLRFNLKDESLLNPDEIKKISGVMGVTQSGGQFQIIIGQVVDKVYGEFCKIGGFQTSKGRVENLDAPRKKKTLKVMGLAILDSLAGCLTPLIPLLIAASIFKMLVAVLGPNMLNVINDKSDLYTLLTFVGDAGFYFLPIIVGYTASLKFGLTPVIGMFMGGILLHPTFVQMATAKEILSVYGIPTTPQNYASTIVPALLTVWVASYLEKFFKRHLPATLRTIFAPSLTVLIMLPISIVVLAPIGGFAGTYFSNALLSISGGGIGGLVVGILVGALWQFLVLSGMHMVMISAMILAFTNTGHEGVIWPAASSSAFAVYGMCLGAFFRIKDKEERSLSLGYLISGILGGVTEPGLYGVGIKYKRPLLGIITGGALGALYSGISNTAAYTFIPIANLILPLNYSGGSTGNLINGIVATIISFVAAAIITYFIGFKKDDPVL
ncbi:PTS transporter subunit EIIC [Neobacillus vireti]|uniref:PTS transporter subunit EIIC n=1 Tax=Neobacillus vireti TaxID=220686 RepID=UPI003000DC4A